jgi:uncharacterized RmlC-like cupin family protein
MRKAKIVRPEAEGLVADTRYGPHSLRATYGIENKTVESPRMTMQHSVIPPGDRNQRHYHINADAGMYIIKGRLRMFFGPAHDSEEVIVEAGDFAFVPAGVIHGLMNLSDTEEAELVATYGGVGSKEEAGVELVEPRWR